MEKEKGRRGGGGFGVGEGRALLRVSFRYPERIVVDHTSIQMSLFHEHTRRQVVATTHATDHSVSIGRTTCCSNTLRRHIAVTNRFVCTGEFL